MENKNNFIGISAKFLNSSLDSVIKNLGKDDFKYLNQECDVLDLVQQERFYPYEYMSCFAKQ